MTKKALTNVEVADKKKGGPEKGLPETRSTAFFSFSLLDSQASVPAVTLLRFRRTVAHPNQQFAAAWTTARNDHLATIFDDNTARIATKENPKLGPAWGCTQSVTSDVRLLLS